jgi:anti-sigma28 factor (negative regulator of flagellin synthesis)
MKVSRPVIKSLAAPHGSAREDSTASSQKQTLSIPTDRAQLSQLSSYLVSALSGSSAHVSKLLELGAEVSNGRYQVDS